MNNISKNKKGFTLVEILAVIALISLIIIIAVPAVKSISYKSKKKLLITKIDLTKEAVNLWGTNNKTCFTEVDGCNVLNECTGEDTITCKTTFGALAANGIINYDETITQDGVEIGYVVNPVNSASLNDEELIVKLENDVVNTECDITGEDGEHINRAEDEDATGEANLPNKPPSSDNQNNVAVLIINANGGEYDGNPGNTIINTKIGNEIELKNPTKDNHKFTEWKIIHGDGNLTEKGVKIESTSLEVQAQYESTIPIPDSFATDSWDTIAKNVRANKEATASVYYIGAEKEVPIKGKNYTVRIANNSNYDCTLDSKTACGFVVEFVDIVEKKVINSSNTNRGGWPESEIRDYLNGEFLAILPKELKTVLDDHSSDTIVVSGHGSSDYNSAREDGNWESTDRIYLLSVREVWIDGSSNPVSSYDTAYTYTITRQLDYYANKGVTSNNYSVATKRYNGSNDWWWLRTCNSINSTGFANVLGNLSYEGKFHTGNADGGGGIAPAFRIG